MPRHKDFGAGRTIETLEPVTFTLAGETFTCKPAVQGLTILKFVSDADSDDSGRAATSIYSFFSSVMSTDEYQRFEAFLSRDDMIFDMTMLAEIAAWLTEQYTERPTQPSQDSESGR